MAYRAITSYQIEYSPTGLGAVFFRIEGSFNEIRFTAIPADRFGPIVTILEGPNPLYDPDTQSFANAMPGIHPNEILA
jgi:hypothetical protein